MLFARTGTPWLRGWTVDSELERGTKAKTACLAKDWAWGVGASGILPLTRAVVYTANQSSSLVTLSTLSTPDQALREAWHDYEAEGVVSVMAEWKASFWQEEYDIYTDTEIWRHK